jgi:hypothetical protein
MIDVTFYVFTYYGGNIGSEEETSSSPYSPLRNHVFVVTALRSTGYILAQKSVDTDHSWQVYASF